MKTKNRPVMFVLVTQRGHRPAVIEGIPDVGGAPTACEALMLLGHEGFRVTAQSCAYNVAQGEMLRVWTLERELELG